MFASVGDEFVGSKDGQEVGTQSTERSSQAADEVICNDEENVKFLVDPEALEEKQLFLQLKKQLGPDFERVFDSKNPLIGEVF